MSFLPRPTCSASRKLVLLAPTGADLGAFTNVHTRRTHCDSMLRDVQKFRGQIGLAEGVFAASDLCEDGRHIQSADYVSWHVLIMDDDGRLGACSRMLVHREGVTFSDLMISHSALARSDVWGPVLRDAVEEQLAEASVRGMHFSEIGGWVVSKSLRCTTEAVRVVLAEYALSQLMGGTLVISTADASNHSSSILRRIGGGRLATRGIELPSYYEPTYHTQLDILRFDSWAPNERYANRIAELRECLLTTPVFCADPASQRQPVTALPGVFAGSSVSRLRDVASYVA